ncbi:MAG: non-heme iron oxygenase ferredoxin subunit [Actinomycetota bacterium]
MSGARFVRAAAAGEIPVEGALAVEIAGTRIALVRTRTAVYALADSCSHQYSRLSEGYVEGEAIECALHGSRFDLRTGRPLGPPATREVATFPVRVEGEDVFVGLDIQPAAAPATTDEETNR